MQFLAVTGAVLVAFTSCAYAQNASNGTQNATFNMWPAVDAGQLANVLGFSEACLNAL